MAQSGIVTLLFTDLVGSTELLDAVGDDAAETLRRRHFQLLRDQVQSSAGQEVKNLGDGLMIVFDSAVDAVACAVGMQRAVDRHNRSHATQLRVRIGLHVGEPIRDEGDYFGLPVVLAQRLCNQAEGGQILASELVAGVVGSRGGFVFQYAGEVSVRSGGSALAAYEVGWQQGHTEDESTELPLPHLLTGNQQFAFAGRAGELEEVLRLWKESLDGQRQAVLLAGEPGIGKTRLAAEVAATAHAAGAVVLYGRCDEELGMPFQPFVEALRFFAEHTPSFLLSERLGRYPGELARVVPELSRLAGDLPAALRSDPETERYRLFDAMADWLSTAARDQPIVLVLDDLHWADKPTLLMLRHVIRSVHTAALLIVGTHRDAEVDRSREFTELLADLRRTPGVERVALRGLDEAGVVELIERASGHDLDEDGLGLARAVHAETEGNPFFVGEVLRHLAETGAVYERDGRWVSDLSIEELGIPEGVREVLTQRLNRLSDDTNRVLRAGAAIGRDFPVDVLQAVLDIDEDHLIDCLEEATSARVIDEARMEAYRFAHVLVRTTLYEGMGAARRVRLHQLIAEAIEARRPGDVMALAHHYAAAGQTAKALDFTLRAARHAADQLAHDQAVGLYQQALSLLDQQAGDAGARADVLIALGEAQRLSGDGSSRETLFEASALAEQLGDTERLVLAALANHRAGWASSTARDDERIAVVKRALTAVGDSNPTWRARLLAILAAEMTYEIDRDAQRAIADESLAIARGLDDADTLSRVLLSRFQSICAPDTLAERMANSREQLELSRKTGDPFVRWYAHFTMTREYLEAGDIAAANEQLDELCQQAEELNQPFPRWQAVVLRANRALLEGDLEAADELSQQGFAFGTDNAQPDAFSYYAALLIPLRLDQGRLQELVPVIADTVAKNPRVPAFRPTLALAYTEDGRDDEARAVFEADAAGEFEMFVFSPSWLAGMSLHADACARLEHRRGAALLYDMLAPFDGQLAFSGASTFGAVSRGLGLLATVLGRFDDAARHFVAAEETHARIGAPTWLARTQLDHARALLKQGDAAARDRAVELIREASTSADRWPLGVVRARTLALLDEGQT